MNHKSLPYLVYQGTNPQLHKAPKNMGHLSLGGEEVPFYRYARKGEYHGYQVRKEEIHGVVLDSTNNFQWNVGIHETDRCFLNERANG